MTFSVFVLINDLKLELLFLVPQIINRNDILYGLLSFDSRNLPFNDEIFLICGYLCGKKLDKCFKNVPDNINHVQFKKK